MKKELWRWAQIAFIVLALTLAAIAIGKQWNEVSATVRSIHPNWIELFGATAVVLFTYAALIQSWRTLVTGWGSVLGFTAAIRIWTIGNLGRYIPGKIWSVSALGILAERDGVSPVAATGSAILGTILWIGSGFGVVALSGNQLRNGVDPRMINASLVCGVLFVAGIVLLPWILQPVARWVGARLKRPIANAALPAKNLWTAVTINSLAWVFYGIAFMLFSRAIVPSIGGGVAAFTAVWALSYLAGYLFVFAPGGLGVREGILVTSMVALGLATTADATVISVMSRLWLTVLELAPGLISLALSPPAVRSALGSRKIT